MRKENGIQRGKLVRVLTLTQLDSLMKERKLGFFATVIECRYRSNKYFIMPWNSPVAAQPYWIGGEHLELPDA